MMTDKKDLRKNLNICLLLTLLLCVLAVVPLFAPQADWRLNAAIFAGQVVLVLPLLYYAKAVLRRGRQLLFGGVPAMEGLAFAACAAGLIGSFALGISALQGGAALNGLLLAPLALMLFLIFAAAYFKTQSGLLDAEADEVLTPDGTAAVLLPAVFALALAAALSWWFRGWGAAAAWQVLGSVLLAAGAGVFMLGGSLPLYYASRRAEKCGFTFADKSAAENCQHMTMAVFDEGFAKTDEQEITDVTGVAISEAQLLALAASVMTVVDDPLAELLKEKAAGMELPVCSGVVKMRGGVTAQCSRKNIRLGQLAFVLSVATVPVQYIKMGDELTAQGKTVFYVTGGRSLLGIIAVGQRVNTGLVPALAELRALGVRTVMFAAGNKQAAEYTGSKAGFAQTVAELTEAHQQELTDAFCRAGEFVAVLKRGEGAQVTVALYNQAAAQCGSIVLNDGNIANLAQAVKLSANLQKIGGKNIKIALWLGTLWAVMAACGWQLLFKTVLPGAVLAGMLVISALAVWLNSKRV
ncbi:HAD family hydrolase [Phascolarctobacterium faecium]|nr:HAD family hydrolase [Phascolarctobacterium faecium]MDM8108342.1 HAD family hydrolase [Phascolarctobacterium faecium]